MPYGMSNEAYAAEVDRKKKAGIPLTSKLDTKAYNAGKASLDKTTTTSNTKPSYGTDDKGSYKIRTDSSKVYKTDENAKYFPDNYGGSAGWNYNTSIQQLPVQPLQQQQLPVQPLQQQQMSMEDILGQLTGSMKEYLMPYEQMYRDVLSNAPSYSMPSESELTDQAQEWADLQVNPLMQAIDRSLQDAQASANEQRGEIEANYAGYEDTVNRLLGEAGNMATESAIARGGGRSGAVEWLTNKLQTPVMEQATTEQAKKTAALNALAEAVGLASEQANTQREELEQQRGSLTSQRLSELQNSAQANATGNWQNIMNATSNLMNMTTQANQYGQNFAANLLPYYFPTVSENMNYNVGLTEALGEVPESLGTNTASASPVPLRSYASERGASIGYDPATKKVTINGKEYSTDQLKNMGGYMQNNAWYIPESALSALL